MKLCKDLGTVPGIFSTQQMLAMIITIIINMQD